MRQSIRRFVAGRGLGLLPLVALLVLIAVPAAVSQAWQGPGHPVDPMEREVFDLVNKERTSRGLKPYILNYSLVQAAWNHSTHMADTNCFDHTKCGDGDPGTRIKATGYKSTTWGENIALGQPDPAAVMDAWMHSSGHRANILGKFTDIGVALVDSSHGKYWTQVFASPAQGYATITPPAGGGSGGGATPAPGVCNLAGDVNGDKKVTQDDVAEVAAHAGARKGEARFAARHDLNDDGVINVLDTYKVLLAVGQACPS